MAASASLNPNQLPNAFDMTQQEVLVDGIITLSGSYTANGDTLNLAGLGIPSNQVPTEVRIFETTPAPGPQSGYAFRYVPGTTQANGLVEIFNGTTQLSAGAYGTPVLGATGFALRFNARFPRFV